MLAYPELITNYLMPMYMYLGLKYWCTRLSLPLNFKGTSMVMHTLKLIVKRLLSAPTIPIAIINYSYPVYIFSK